LAFSKHALIEIEQTPHYHEKAVKLNGNLPVTDEQMQNVLNRFQQ